MSGGAMSQEKKAKTRRGSNYQYKPTQLVSSGFYFSAILFLFIIVMMTATSRDYFYNYFYNPLKNSAASKTTVAYLKNLSHDNADKPFFYEALLKQQIKLGQVASAKKSLATFEKITQNKEPAKTRWYHYQILRQHFFSLKPKDKNYKIEKKKLLTAINQLHIEKLNDGQIEQVASDALGIGALHSADILLTQAIKKYPLSSVALYQQAARVKLYLEQYNDSAKLLFTAMNRSSNNKAKLFIQAVKTIEYGGNAKYALEQALSHITSITSTKQANIYMARLALRANQPAVAEKYIMKVLLKPNNKGISDPSIRPDYYPVYLM